MTSPQSSSQSSRPSYDVCSEFAIVPEEASASLLEMGAQQETDGGTANSRLMIDGAEEELRSEPASEITELANEWMHRKERTAKEQEVLDKALTLRSKPTTEDPDGNRDDESSDDDKRFMEETRRVAQNSPDPNTKVGAIIVNPKTKEIVATGWNRMPVGCEERFEHKWSGESKDERTKHHYVVFAARAAIFDGLMKGEDLEGCTMYTTLNPSNICAQCIREVGIAEVVYSDDKFWTANFMVASRRILEGIKCRKM